MASQNRRLSKGLSTVDASKQIGVETQLFKTVDGLEVLGLLDLNLFDLFFLLLHALLLLVKYNL